MSAVQGGPAHDHLPHLDILAREARPAGGAAEARARAYAERILTKAGFTVSRTSFSYSQFPGRFGTPAGGALLGVAIVAAAILGLTGAGRAALVALCIGGFAVAGFAYAMLGDGVLNLPIQRAISENLIATRGDECPCVWLVAHLDSKSQPVPSLIRMTGVALLLTSVVTALAASLLQLLAAPHRTMWWGAIIMAVVGALPLMASVVGVDSDGAVDNASGVSAVLAAAAQVRPGTAVGVLLPSAEELGLAGARSWARSMSNQMNAGVALNCDGVDDAGELTIMYSGERPTRLIDTLTRLAASAPRARRMPLGLLTDSVALADRGWTAVTVSRGSLGTLRRVHRPSDSLANLRGTGIGDMATLLARAVEALA
ncbi:MAG: M28 family peptidase [Gemmatimonadaceae bacterium]